MPLAEAWRGPEFVSASAAILGVGFLCKPPLASDSELPIFCHFLGIACGLVSAISLGAMDVNLFQTGRVKVTAGAMLAEALAQLIISPFAVAASRQQLRLFSQQQLGLALLMAFLGFASQIAQQDEDGTGEVGCSPGSSAQLVFNTGDAVAMAGLSKGGADLDKLCRFRFSLVGCSVLAEDAASPVPNVTCMSFKAEESSAVYGKRCLRLGRGRRQAELALAEVQWSSKEELGFKHGGIEALDVLLDVKFQLSATGKPLEDNQRNLRTVEEEPAEA
eukprot:Skav206370  [mRNA]  locus=scaffold834:46349:53538:+ [translate_table: standard]